MTGRIIGHYDRFIEAHSRGVRRTCAVAAFVLFVLAWACALTGNA